MRKKIVLLLLTFGILLLISSGVLATVAVGNALNDQSGVGIIGGSDLPSAMLALKTDKRYLVPALLGLAALVAASVVAIIKRKKNHN